jgi:hypothetical protein
MEALATFGQELYPEASAAALRLALAIPDRQELRDAIARHLGERSPATRERIADKLIQRLVPTQGGKVVVDAFVRLAAGTQDAHVRRDLIFYRTATVDRLVGAIAGEILYPCLILRRRPKAMSAEHFRATTATLFNAEPTITLELVRAYVESAWDFHSPGTVARALRILRRAGVIHQVQPGDGVTFAASARAMSPEAFAFCIYEEMLRRGNRAPALDQLQNAECARIFLLTAAQVAGLLEECRGQGLLRGGRRFTLVYDSLDDLVTKGLGLAPR